MIKRTSLLILLGLLLMTGDTRAGTSPSSVLSAVNVTASPVIDMLDLKDVDVKDSLKMIASKSGLNIVFNNNIQGRVSLYLEKVAVRDALAMVLELNNLAYEENAGMFQVMTGAEYQTKFSRPFSQRVESRVFHLKGMKAEQAAALLERLRSPFGKVVGDSSSSTILVEDTPQKIDEVVRYLDEVDKPVLTRVFELSFLDAETASQRATAYLTPQVGSLRADKQSNKIFVLDTSEAVERIAGFIKEIDIPRTPMVFNLSYAKADDLLPVLRQYLTPGFGTLELNKRSNQLVLIDTGAKVKELGEIIKQLDHKEKEVLIEARIVQVVLSDEFKMGVDWDAVITRAHGLELKSSLGGVGTASNGSLAIGTLSNDNYQAVVEALGSINKSHVLSKPRIAVVNNEEAHILVGTTKPYVTTTTSTPLSGQNTVSEDVKFIDVGVKLSVTPMIHEDGFITIKIRPEVSSALDSIKTSQNNVIPIVDKSEVETTVRVKDGVTIMIGGLIKDEKSRLESKVPLLGDIPVLGHAFKNQTRGVGRTEIVIFLTPKIITGDVK